jgi:hypothetical protein
VLLLEDRPRFGHGIDRVGPHAGVGLIMPTRGVILCLIGGQLMARMRLLLVVAFAFAIGILCATRFTHPVYAQQPSGNPNFSPVYAPSGNPNFTFIPMGRLDSPVNAIEASYVQSKATNECWVLITVRESATLATASEAACRTAAATR